MAKRKTNQTINNEKVPATKGTANTISYNGTIKVSVVRDKTKKVISTKTYHNSGTITLFEFIAQALVGTLAQSNLPTFLSLYGNYGEGLKADDESTWITVGDSSNYTLAGPIVRYNDSGAYISENKGIATFEFRVPYAYITSQIYYMGLLNSSGEKCLAKFALLNNTGNDFAPIDNNVADNYSLIIRWELKIGNGIGA